MRIRYNFVSYFAITSCGPRFTLLMIDRAREPELRLCFGCLAWTNLKVFFEDFKRLFFHFQLFPQSRS